MKRLLSFVLVAAAAGCSAGSEPTSHESVPSPEAPNASAAHAASPEGAARAQTFVEARYKASEVRHSFRSKLGQDIDCIDFAAQPGVKTLAARGRAVVAPPELPAIPSAFATPAAHAEDETLDSRVAFAGDADENGNARACPEGTVPQVRITADQVQRAGGVDGFRSRVHRKAPPKRVPPPDQYGDCEGDTPGYAHVVETLNTGYVSPIPGASSTMAIYDASIPSDPSAVYDHSISQTWLYNELQTLEVGWNVDGSLYDGDTNVPHLFIYSTDDDYQVTGCYNDWDWAFTGGSYDDAGDFVPGTCIPWVQVSKRYVPGMNLPANPAEAVNPRNSATLPKELSLSTVQIGGNWWFVIQVAGGLPELLGYYDGTVINAPMTVYQSGGEVFDDTGLFTDPTLQMGSGQLPSKGQGFAGYQRNYFALVPGLGLDAGGPVVSDAYVCTTYIVGYTYSATPAPVSQQQGPWLNYFYYGNDNQAAAAPQAQ